LGWGIDPDLWWPALAALIGRAAWSWGGPPARALLGVLGVGTAGAVPGVAANGDLGSLLRDPAAAVRSRLLALAMDPASIAGSGLPLAVTLLELARDVLTPSPDPDLEVGGTGSSADPWAVPLHAAGSTPVELLAAVGPDGPPGGWGLGPLLDL